MVVVLPLYLLVLVLEVMIVLEPSIFLCHRTLFIGRIELTVQSKVTSLLVVTEYDGFCTSTVGGGSKI